MTEDYMKPRPKKRHRRTAKGGIPQTNPFVEFLQETTIDQIIPPKRTVIVLDDTNTVGEALKLLSKFQILSAPVLDIKTKSFLGFVDMLDIVGFAVSLYDENDDIDPVSLYEKSSVLLSKPIKDIMDLSKVNPVCDVRKNSPLFQCIGLFQKGLHRVAVSNEEGKIVNILSQSDVIRFLTTKMDQYNSIFDKTATELNLAQLPPITIEENQPTIKALKIMHQKRISALAVVNSNGVLVGNISASDLKGAVTTDDDSGADQFGSLLLPVMTYLKQGGMSIFPVASCTKNTALNYILLRLMALRVHRLWVTDEITNKPIGVISITDVMKAIIDQKQAERKEVY